MPSYTSFVLVALKRLERCTICRVAIALKADSLWLPHPGDFAGLYS